MLADDVSEIVEDAFDLTLGSAGLINQDVLVEPLNVPLNTVNDAVYPFEVLAVVYYIMIIITLLLPWLLCCSKKYSY